MKKPKNEASCSFSISNDGNSPQKLLFERLANKWFLMILADLYHNTNRFNNLLKTHPSLSQKMLAQTLKKLEEDVVMKNNRLYHTFREAVMLLTNHIDPIGPCGCIYHRHLNF